MAQLLLIGNSSISHGRQNFNGKEYFNILKKQSLETYECLLLKSQETNLNLYLPQTFNHILSCITSVNQFILNLNLFLQKHYSKQNNDQEYNHILLETIFAHHNIFGKNSIFDNKLSPQFSFLFDFLDNSDIETKNLYKIKEIAIIFCIIESFFRHHQAHGLSNSLIDFFRGHDINIFPAFIMKEEYLLPNNFKSFDYELDKFYFLCSEEHFNHFKNNVFNILKEIKNFEILNNIIILDEKLKHKIENIFTYSEDKKNIKNPSKKDLNPFNYFFFSNDFNQNFFFIRSEIIRSYFKYNSIVWNNDKSALNIDLINEGLSLMKYNLTNNSQIIYEKDISITPNSLLEYFKEFVNITENTLFKK